MTSVWETFQTRDRTDPDADSVSARLQRTCAVRGTDDDDVALTEARAFFDLTFRGLVRQRVDIRRTGPLLWEGLADYGDPEDLDSDEKPDQGEIIWSCDTGGGTVHITSTKQNTYTAFAPAGETAPDFKGAIGVTNGFVEGVDIVIPKLLLRAEVRLPNLQVTDSYVRDIARLTGKVNNAPWKGYAAGELLFLGASGRQSKSSGTTWSYNFEASENSGQITIGDITVGPKLGHEYLWVHYVPTDDAVAKAVVQQPKAVYIHAVYELGDFTLLGLGT